MDVFNEKNKYFVVTIALRFYRLAIVDLCYKHVFTKLYPGVSCQYIYQTRETYILFFSNLLFNETSNKHCNMSLHFK